MPAATILTKADRAGFAREGDGVVMLSFAVYSNGAPATGVNLNGAYLIGSDDVPLRAELTFKDGVITCKKRSTGPAGLGLLWPVSDVGTILLETVRLLERKQPYILSLELARGRLMRINQKLEEWGLLNLEQNEARFAEMNRGRETLITALQADTPAQAAERGEKALAASVGAGESIAGFQAEASLMRRKQAGAWPKRLFGCSVHLDSPQDLLPKRLSGAFDFISVPFIWRDIEPSEQTFNWKPLDALVETIYKMRMPMKGSSLLSFHERYVPPWLVRLGYDFDAIRDLAFEHARRVISRYGQYIQTWDVISGIHAYNCFNFTFEQIIELTRMAAALTKQTLPRSTVIVDLVAPWGEYYARNQRTIPPLLYADMVTQSVAHFDAFGLQFRFGPGIDGMYVRDMFQISSQLDQFARMGKPVHITAVEVPSEAASGEPSNGARLDGGSWHGSWSESVQGEWLREFVQIALSKPFVDSFAWHHVADNAKRMVPFGGLLRPDFSPKPAFQQWLKLRSEILGTGRRGEGG